MLLATLVPKLIGFRACIPRSLSATLSSSSDSSSESTSLNEHKRQLRQLSLDEAIQLEGPDYLHAAHCLLYSRIVDNEVEGIYGLCQMRFDGQIGFPGGVVGDGKEIIKETSDLIAGLERELREEINYHCKPNENLDSDLRGFDHISTYIDDSIDRSKPGFSHRVNVYHFFAKQISEEELNQCESEALKSQHFPLESLGLFRIPIIDPENCSDQTIFRYYKKRGTFLANFFKHNFAGIGKNQLFDTLVRFNCLSPDYLSKLEQIIQGD